MHEYTQLRMVSAYSKGSELQFEHDRPWHWKDDAACAFQPSSLFELADTFSPISEGIVPSGDDPVPAIKDLNTVNFERALEICASCPVLNQCEEDAEPGDFRWTVRAGRLPVAYNAALAGRPVVTSKTCGEGHEMTKRPGNGWYCLPCQNEKAKARRRGEGSGPRKPKKIFSRGKLCRKGEHDSWFVNASGKNACHPCKVRADAAYRATITP